MSSQNTVKMEDYEPYYVSDAYEEEELDTELIDVELEELDFKSQGKERCKDNFLNISCNVDDIKSDGEDDILEEDIKKAGEVDSEDEEFGSVEDVLDESVTGEPEVVIGVDEAHSEVVTGVDEQVVDVVEGLEEPPAEVQPRRPSERIINIKLGKRIAGVGSSAEQAIELE